MQTVRYSTSRVAMMCVALIGFIFAGVWAYGAFYGKAAFAGALIAAVGIVCLPMMARYLIGGGVILEYDRINVTFHGVLSTTRLRWDQVGGIEVEEQTYNWVAKNRYLKIKGPFSLLGYASVTERLLARDHRPIDKLLDQILTYLEEPQETPGVERAAAGMRSTVVVGAMSAPQIRGGGFGRKGL